MRSSIHAAVGGSIVRRAGAACAGPSRVAFAAAGLAGLAALSPFAHAGVAEGIRVLAKIGDPVTSIPGARLAAANSGNSTIAITGDAGVVFAGLWTPADNQGQFPAIFLATPEGIEVIARQGPAPEGGEFVSISNAYLNASQDGAISSSNASRTYGRTLRDGPLFRIAGAQDQLGGRTVSAGGPYANFEVPPSIGFNTTPRYASALRMSGRPPIALAETGVEGLLNAAPSPAFVGFDMPTYSRSGQIASRLDAPMPSSGADGLATSLTDAGEVAFFATHLPTPSALATSGIFVVRIPRSCDSIDANLDGISPDPQDVAFFLNAFAGARASLAIGAATRTSTTAASSPTSATSRTSSRRSPAGRASPSNLARTRESGNWPSPALGQARVLAPFSDILITCH